jgi:3',5'-cyclic AMP phosphodiesterase CpdA
MSDPVEAGRVLTRIPGLRAPERTRLAVLADPHLAARAEGTWKCYHRTERFLERAVEGVGEVAPDATIVAGDLTKDGEEYNFDRYDEVAAPLADPLTIPGNHDVPKEYVEHDVMPVADFADRYTDDGYPFRRRVGGVDVFCLNSAAAPDGSLRDTWGGRVSEAQLEWLTDRLPADRLSVVAVHHNLFAQPEHRADDHDFWWNFPLENRTAVQEVLADAGPVLVLSGHHHIPSYRSEGDVHEVVAPALCSYPPSYLVVDVGPEGTVVHRIPVTTPTERTEAYTLGASGKELGQAVVELAADRLGSEPL